MTSPDHTSEFDLKRCSKCGILKSRNEFYPRKDKRDGLRNDCRDCVRARAIAYYLAHPESMKKRSSEYVAAHYDEVCARQSRYRQAHKSDHAEYSKSYRANNKTKVKTQKARWYSTNREYVKEKTAKRHKLKPEISRAANRRRKDRIKGTSNIFTSEDWQRCIGYWHGTCAYCGNPPSLFDRDLVLQMDHYIPISDAEHCPGTTPCNIIPACQTCNYSKKASDPREWLVWKFGSRKAKQIEKRIQEYFNSLKERDI